MKQALCINGPLSGKHLTAYGVNHQCPITPPVPAYPTPSSKSPLEELDPVEVFTYTYHEMHVAERHQSPSKIFAFWVPEGTEKPNQLIMETLLAGHNDRWRLRTLIARAHVVIDWLMPGLRYISVPRYDELNDVMRETAQIMHEDRA
jgi:hypothetical protein